MIATGFDVDELRRFGHEDGVRSSFCRPGQLQQLMACVFLGVCLAFASSGQAAPVAASAKASLVLTLHKELPATAVFAPLEQISVDVTPPTKGLHLEVSDPRGHVYVSVNDLPPGQRFRVEGALGVHKLQVSLRGKVMLTRELLVDAHTDVSCTNALFDVELRRLAAQLRAAGSVATIDGATVRLLSNELRESRYVNAATRFFETDVRSGLDLFLNAQRPSGLVYSAVQRDDHYDPYTNSYPGVSMARDMFGEDFTARSRDGRWFFERTPSFADVESMAVGWAHDVWQATGDDEWLAAVMPTLEKALGYLQTDPLRWSPEKQLVKRAFTIDVWGAQDALSGKIHPRGGLNKAGWFDGLFIDRDSAMGIAHGDNTAFYEAATLMARMNAHLGNPERASQWTQAAENLRENLDKTAWNGTFYRHFVRLLDNPLWQQLEGNESRQLSMSNPFAITRGAATHAQALAIVGEYQRRYDKCKGQCLGEWSALDPPFRKGFGHWGPYEGPNGNLTPIVAGALGHAALEHGAEVYGADIFRRLLELQRRHAGLHGFYNVNARPIGWQPEEFQSVDLRTIANRHLRGDQPSGFIEHPDNDLRAFPTGRNFFLGKPFDVIDPKDNGGRAAVVLWGAGSPGPRETTVAGIGKKARSIYFLHSAGNIRRQSRVGEYVVNYADGSKVRIPLVVGRNIGGWWAEGDAGEWRVAWRGKNPHVSIVAMGVWGWENNQPNKEIESITIRASGQGRIQLLGISLSSGPVQFDRGEVASDTASTWAAGVVWKGAMESLAGVVDRDRLMEHVALSPRWLALGETRAAVTVRYGPSRGYVAYRWEHRSGDRTQSLVFSGSGKRFDFRVLMPAAQKPRDVTLNGKKLRFRTETVENSVYADFSLEGTSAGVVDVTY
ncbi:MAG: hypothetical protein SF187_27040 [Deltaproteobacteria bacterium]|nr:hypothetical protein [Deltaproteobacteria bacterium]